MQFSILALAAAVFATSMASDCIPSAIHADACTTLDLTVPEVNTLGEVKLLNRFYNGDVRVEEINGTFAMIQHSTSAHVGTVSGDALTYLQERSDSIEKRQTPACSHNACVTVISCGIGCAFCYPVICV